jgi:hypothetical protein
MNNNKNLFLIHTNPLILEEQNSFKIIGTIFWNGELCHDNME